MQKVLIDSAGQVKISLNEDKESRKLIAEGKIGQCGIPTANGRIYTYPVLEREIGRLQERINGGALLGAVDHPGDGKARLMEAGHIVRKLWLEKDGSVHGRFEIVEESDAGRNLAAFLRRGASIGMSSRGLGSTYTNEQGQEVVGEDFKLVTYDFVCDPAVSTAYPKFFTEDKDIAEQVTVDALKAKFPALVKQIEEKAHEVARVTTQDALKTQMESDVELALKDSREKIKEEIKAQVLPDIIKECRDDFSVKLVRSLQSMRKEVEESVRSEFASDPKVAGAKLTLEQVAKLVSPFSPPADVKQLLSDKDNNLSEVNKALSDAKKQLEDNNARYAKLETVARDLGAKLFVEKAVSGRDDADSIKERIGNISNYQRVEDLQRTVTTFIKQADESKALAETKAQQAVQKEKKLSEHKLALANKRAQLAEEEKVKLVNDLTQRVETLSAKLEVTNARKEQEAQKKEKALQEANEKIAKLQSAVSKAGVLIENLNLQNYVEKRAPSKKAQILEALNSGKIKSIKEINKLAEDLETKAEEPGSGLGEKIRRHLAKGKETKTEVELQKEKPLHEQVNSVPGFEGLEQSVPSINEIKQLAGIE